jgi:peptidoglycan hydrolase-like protein with peptidoglycan-binding domain
MAHKLLLARGARGELVRRAQSKLAGGGLDVGTPDGDYGERTARAVAAFRRRKRLGRADHVDAPTWEALVGRPLPSVRDRALQVTAAFEGHGFTLVQGNYDDAWLTWGVIGFTLRHGELRQIVLEAHRRRPQLLVQAFGPRADELLAVMRAPKARQLAWANSISLGPRKVRVAEPWRTAFARFGELPVVQKLQLERVDVRFGRARELARSLGLVTELGLALAFDIVVQNGSVSAGARARIEREVAAHPIHKERELRVIVANAVADASRPAYREDVRSRKLTLATGAGRVHGATYVLRNWGLDASRAR